MSWAEVNELVFQIKEVVIIIFSWNSCKNETIHKYFQVSSLMKIWDRILGCFMNFALVQWLSN